MFTGSSFRRALWVASMSVLAIVMAPRPGSAQTAAPNACLTCHATLTDARLSKPAVLFSAPDVHREHDFACVDCHGGDPAAADKARSHDAARGFIRLWGLGQQTQAQRQLLKDGKGFDLPGLLTHKEAGTS